MLKFSSWIKRGAIAWDRTSCQRRPERPEHSLFRAVASLHRQWMLAQARTPSAIPSDCISYGDIFQGNRHRRPSRCVDGLSTTSLVVQR
ncbi:hypothetical protein [Mesorhizobium hawassense]|uniref:hypothetical protein n=1 Tax=Mesorhizobium hawassense TaxID=1209954 RepID=UPI0011BF048C|nr:hypothetical protein [Mesorhizobium hawassense]